MGINHHGIRSPKHNPQSIIMPLELFKDNQAVAKAVAENHLQE